MGDRPGVRREPPGLVDLFYDDGCGPCTLWARLSQAFGHSRIRIHPLNGPTADRELATLPTAERFGSFHLVTAGRIRSGADGVPALLGLVAGPAAGRAVERVGPLRQWTAGVYHWFWEYRQTHGCAAAGTGDS